MTKCAGWTWVVVAGLWAGATAGDLIPQDQVPAKVLEAAKAKFPKAAIDSVVKNAPGKKAFEFNLKEGDRKFQAKFSEDGKIFETEERVKEADLPPPVKEAFAKRYPKLTIYRIEKETKYASDPPMPDFKIVFNTADGKKREAKFTPKGEFLKEKDH